MDETEENEVMEVNSSDDSSSSDDEDQALVAKTEELERSISENKYLYDAHLELVELYRRLGDLNSLRAAFERFSEVFPLTPQIWLSWINDEKKLATTAADAAKVFALFDKAVEDYLSVELWVEYAQYSLGVCSLEETREILARGLNACGLHASQGILLWDTLRVIEITHLSLHEADTEQYKAQLIQIGEAFRRQLSVPLIGMENTYAEWCEWQKTHPEIDPKPIEWGYQKAIKTLNVYREFEDKLLTTQVESEVYQIYKDYIKKLDDPSTILCVYERAVAQLCLFPNIWSDYITYAIKFGEMSERISKRALRNCTWTADIWVLHLRVLELLKSDKVMEQFEQALSIVGSTNQELWLAYLEYSKRTSEDQGKLYKLFEQAVEQLGYPNEANSKIVRFYSRVLANNGDMGVARKLWKNILKGAQNKISAAVWLEYANLERLHGDKIHVRSIFERALDNVTDWPQSIVDEWLMFERECGTLDDILKSTEKCKKISQQPQNVSSEMTQLEKGKKRKAFSTETVEVKRKKIEDKHEFKTPFARDKPKPPIVKNPKKTVFISNLYPSINEKRLWKVFPNAENIELVHDKQGKSRCYGYVQFEMEEEVMTALARDRELLDNRPIFISNCKPDRTERKASFKYSSDKESNKLFVKGLPVSKSQEDIEEIFKKFEPKSVRLVVHKSGQSKGLAYVEFDTEVAAKKAIESTDKMKIDGHVISVAISAPPVKTSLKNSSSSVPVRHSKSRLQVPLIPRTLQVKKAESNGSSGSATNQPKSNADFRKMLFDK